MAYISKAEIKIGTYKFTYYHKIEIESSWEKGDTAKIYLPKMKQVLEDNLKNGDVVEIYAGYEKKGEKLPLLFKGFVKSLSPKIPFEVICDDQLFTIKRKRLENKTFPKTSLKEVLNYILGSFKAGEIPDIKLSNFQIKNATVAEALQSIEDNYFVSFYQRPDSDLVWVGIPYTEKMENRIPVFNFQKNIISTNLIFQKKEDIRIQAEVVNLKKDNTRQKFKIGDPDGEVRTIFLRTETNDVAELKKLAERELEKTKYTGYKGSFTAFGTPIVRHGQKVEIQDEIYPQRKGTYIVDSVKYEFSVPTFRQIISLGKQF